MSGEVRDEFQLTGRRIDERYEVVRPVAAGGFGVVYLGQHRALKSAVAVKVLRLPPKLTEAERREFAQKFLAEAQTIAGLQHPAVVRALDFGVSTMPNGVTAPWAALEWVDGQTLGASLAARRGEPMAPREALALLRPVLDALAVAHALGIAHRDIKPANIMIPRVPVGSVVSRVLDFGIAKTMRPGERASGTGRTQTTSGLPAFTLRYAAPEQVGLLRTGPWTDVHALALVLIEAITGRPAYAGGDAMALTAAVLDPKRPTPAALGFDAGPWEPVLAKALAFRPADRYADAGELRDALVRDAPDALHPVGPGARAVPATALMQQAPRFAPTEPVGGAPERPRRGAVTRRRVAAAVAVGGGLAALAAASALVAGRGAPRGRAGASGGAGALRVPEEQVRRFEPLAFLDEARRIARRESPGVELGMINASNVRPDGTIDLRDAGGWSAVSYVFVAPGRTTAPCGARTVGVTADGAIHTDVDDGQCLAARDTRPRCTVAQVWRRAIADRASQARAARGVVFFATPYNPPVNVQWTFMGRDGVNLTYPDDCP